MNVKFYSVKLKSTFDAIETKDALALYWIAETSELYKGDQLFGTGAEASAKAAGLMSIADKKKLDELVAASGNLNLTAVDGTINLVDVVGGKSIGVAISAVEGNALVAVEDGLFVPVSKEIEIPEYAIEKQDIAEDGFATSYKLKKTVNGEISYVGDTINIAKDMVLQSATLEVVVEANVPYEGAEVGDPYIDMAFNDAAESHIYIPVNGLVDTYTAGDGIEIVDGKISVNIAKDSNGLVAVDGALKINLATAESAGALSAVDKAFIDLIPKVYATKEMVKDTAVQVKYNISATPEGTLVNYGEDVIRIMCPADAKFVKQNVGDGGNANMYYMTFTTYAPEGAVTFKEGDRGVLVDEVLDFENTAGTGVDKYGRKFKNHWFALATYDEASDTWSYFGKNSSVDKYIGWDYVVEYYDENNVAIARDSIRINLSNENCHDVSMPYYMAKYATIDQVKDAYSWGEL